MGCSGINPCISWHSTCENTAQEGVEQPMPEKPQEEQEAPEMSEAKEASRIIETSNDSQPDSPYEHPDLLYGE